MFRFKDGKTDFVETARVTAMITERRLRVINRGNSEEEM